MHEGQCSSACSDSSIYTATSNAKIYACKKITSISNRVNATPARIVTADKAVQPLNCQKKKFVAENSSTKMMCPTSMFAIRRTVKVAGRKMNVERISSGMTKICNGNGRFGITTELLTYLKKP